MGLIMPTDVKYYKAAVVPHVNLDEQTQNQIKSQDKGFEDLDTMEWANEDVSAFIAAPKQKPTPAQVKAAEEKKVEKPALSAGMQAAIRAAGGVVE